jgi:formate hydrogenlyase subunit 3/multisubunit Na+/H+ antiporter MnhD subunit
MVAPTVVLVVVGLVIAAAAGPLFRLSERTARDLLEPRQYVEVVLDR